MRVGVVVPTFEDSPALALAVARQAEAEDLDGVFMYDHLFPLRQPDRPALACVAMLAAVASITSRVRLGPLVSRVSLLPPEVLVDALATIDDLADGRLIAGLGTGDRMTIAENAAYGLPFPPRAERLALLETVAAELRGRGIQVWIGGRSGAIRELAARVADGWNCWDGSAAELAALSPPPTHHVELTWGGPPPADGELIGHLRSMARRDVGWVIYGPRTSVDWPAFMTKLAGAARAVR